MPRLIPFVSDLFSLIVVHAETKMVLFPFGYGLSYTTYNYSGLKVTPGKESTVTFTVKNMGSRAGTETAEVYAGLPATAGGPPKPVEGWVRGGLEPGGE